MTGPTAGSVELIRALIVIGLLGAAAAALFGAGWLAASRRRGGGYRERAPRSEMPDEAGPVALPIVEQRTLRHARTRLRRDTISDPDPIVAALGLDPARGRSSGDAGAAGRAAGGAKRGTGARQRPS